jgi:hypothetical protein
LQVAGVPVAVCIVVGGRALLFIWTRKCIAKYVTSSPSSHPIKTLRSFSTRGYTGHDVERLWSVNKILGCPWPDRLGWLKLKMGRKFDLEDFQKRRQK